MLLKPCVFSTMKDYLSYLFIYDWICQNGVNNLRQITHLHFDFPTSKGSLQAVQKAKSTERRAIKRR